MRSALPDEYVIGRGVLVPPRVALLLLVRGGLSDYQRRARGDDPQVDAVLAAFVAEALAWRRAAGSRHPDATVPRLSEPWSQKLSTTEAARRIGVSHRTVLRNIAAGRLPAERVGGRFVLDLEDVEHHRIRRKSCP